MFQSNLILLTDSYKITHWKQYPPGTSRVYSYFESRGGYYQQTVFFGLQYFIKRHLDGRVVSYGDIEEASNLLENHLGPGLFNYKGWAHIVRDHRGHLPVIIKAVPEGMVVPTHNVLITIENTCDQCFWLTNYLETLLVQTWYPTTVATQSYYIRKNILRYLNETGDPGLIDFKLHDFGFRGVSSAQSAGIGGCAHLVNFKGTDTLAALDVAEGAYGEPCAGFSIPAAEHSTITSWGEEGEVNAFENMLIQFPKGMVAVVSDSYDTMQACSDKWGTILKDKVLARDGVLVVRPDSGYPPDIVLDVIQTLGDKFGYITNEKGYKVLNPKIRVIQGDGVDYSTIDLILTKLKMFGWSADNVAFGMGGALLQKLHRDTQNMAFKCSNVTINGTDYPVYKNPITDSMKKSKKGKLKLVIEEGAHGVSYKTVQQTDPGEDILRTVFDNGTLIVEDSLKIIRERALNTSSIYWNETVKSS
jgi:nicotinamide phosphoribosyltransferase